MKENIENNKASDEDKSKDRINFLNENEKSSLFNLDFTNITKNDIVISNSLKLDKEYYNSKSSNRTEKKKSVSKISSEKKNNNITKVNALKIPRNSFNSIIKNKTIDVKDKMEEREISRINFLSNRRDISFNKKEKKFKKDKKNLLDKYYDTISSSCDNFYSCEKNKKNKIKNINKEK